MVDIANLAKDWITAASIQIETGKLDDKTDKPIIDLLELCDNDPDEALKVILVILEQQCDSKVVNYLGAGPLEDLLSKHYGKYSENLVKKARANRKLYECLKNVCLDKDDTPDYLTFYKVLGVNPPHAGGEL